MDFLDSHTCWTTLKPWNPVLSPSKNWSYSVGDVRQVVDILQTAGALEAGATSLLPLGRTAVAVRGVNELWLALAFRNDSIMSLTPSQLAAACGTLVSEGMKTSSRDSSRC